MNGDTQSFIVRIWREAVDTAGNVVTWRGSIDHVGTGRRVYFHDLDSALRFIQQQVGLQGRHYPWWRSLLARIKHPSS